MKRASRAWSQRMEVHDGRDLSPVLWPRRPQKDRHGVPHHEYRGTGPGEEIRTFRTMTAALLALADWLQEAGCTHGAMESTGVYWRPVYNLLEGQFALLVVNAQHIKAVPGRKTDVKAAAWIAEL